MKNKNNSKNLSQAKKEKNDEFYTQYCDIEKEMQAYLEYKPDIFKDQVLLLPCDNPEWSNFTKYFVENFSRLKLKKIISTSYSDLNDTRKKGKILTMGRDNNCNNILISSLKGNGDFRSDEIKKLRDESDIIITNPPFSLFRVFLNWVMEANKKFSIIGNMNSVTCKDVFPLIQKNRLWFGATISSGDREFRVPDNYPLNSSGFRVDNNGSKYIRVKGVRWFSNIEHGRRHDKLLLKKMKENIEIDQKILNKKNAYKEYDNYNAIEIPKTRSIPKDYNGIMGVPISFLDKYNPEQFEIVGMDFYVKDGLLNNLIKTGWNGKLDRAYLNGSRLYSRILIHNKEGVR